MTLLSTHKLSAGYGPCEVISNISISAKPSEFIALVGPNGGGKSTLIKSLAGLIHPLSGQIELSGENIAAIDLRIRARKIAYLAQQREALPSMTVADILELGRAPYRGRLGQISQDGQDAITRAVTAAQLEAFMDREFGTLSGGEQARALLGRALAVDADLLLADEPIAALDPYYQLSMMDILKAETQSGKTVITALHDLSLAAQYADRVWVMHQGKIVSDDRPERALSREIIRDVFKVDMSLSSLDRPQIIQSE